MTLARLPYELIQDRADLNRWCTKLAAVKGFAIDTETTGVESARCDLVGVSLTVEWDGVLRSAYIPIAHHNADKQLPWEVVKTALGPICEDPDIIKVLHNATYDVTVLVRHGVKLANVHDTILMSFLLDPTVGRHNMDLLAHKHFDYDTAQFGHVVPPHPLAGARDFRDVRLDDALYYACEDTEVTYRLYARLKKKLKQEGQWHIFTSIDRHLPICLGEMKARGIMVDLDRVAELEDEWSEIMAESEAAVHEYFPGLNLNSPTQLQSVLYGKKSEGGLGLPVYETTKTGNPATGADVLKLYEDQHPTIPHMVTYKTYNKLVGTYLSKTPPRKNAATFPVAVNPETGALHCNLNLTSTTTFRLSSSGPNLQQVPGANSGERGVEIRRVFHADEGNLLCVADYGNIELRILAHITQEPVLLEAFRANRDIHAEVAGKIFGVTKEEVGDVHWAELRTRAKRVTFGLIYGITSVGLAKQLKVEQDIAQEFMDRYFEELPYVDAYIRAQKLRGVRDRVVHTLFGRRLPVEKRRDRAGVGMAERQSVNYVVQGSAADLMRLGIVKVTSLLEASGLRAYPLLSVHDELVCEAHEDDAEEAKKLLSHGMETAADHLIDWSVPIVADAAIGHNWHEAK